MSNLKNSAPSENEIRCAINLTDSGDNLIDHTSFDVLNFNTDMPVEAKTVKEYINEWLKGEGLYSIAVGIQALAFHKSKYAGKQDGSDIIFDFIPPNPLTEGSVETSIFTRDIAETLFENVNLKTTLYLGIMNAHPLSRGTVRLKSKNPYEFPLIDYKTFSDDLNHDVEVIYEGIKLALKLQETEIFKKHNATLAKFEIPQCKQFKYLSEEFWKCSIKYLTDGGYHLFGTSKMGPDPNDGDVVDARLRVHGIKNLRVADASVIIKCSGFPVAPTMMVGEKASTIIKRHHLF